MIRTVPASLFAAFLLAAALSTPTSAQTLQGRLVDDATGAPVSQAQVVVLDIRSRPVQRALTDESGAFSVSLPVTGRYVIRASRVGYQTVSTPPMDVLTTDNFDVEVRIATGAVPLAPLTVTARRAPIVADGTLMRRGYYTRKQQYEHLGAHFLDREYINRRGPFRTTDIFRDLPGVRVVPGRERSYQVRMRGNCEPAVFIDGTYVNRFQVQREESAPRSIRPRSGGGGAGTGSINPDDVRERQLREGETTSIDMLVAPSSIAAIEVYQMNQVPAEYTNFSNTPCGVIVIWTGGETA